MGNGSRAKAAFVGLALCVVTAVTVVAFHARRGSHRGVAPAHDQLSMHLNAGAPGLADLSPSALYGKLPLSFEENRGQAASAVRYLARGSGYELFLTKDEAVLSLSRPAQRPSKRTGKLQAAQVSSSVLRMELAGANQNAEVLGIEPQPGKTSYFVGNDPAKWRTGIPSYSKVEYRGVYPGIDMLFHGKQRRLEYDFIVAPGADPKAIALQLQGARALHLDRSGNLRVSVPGGSLDIQKPLVYQEHNGIRQQIAGGFILSGDQTVKFDVGSYDATRPLVLDPVVDYGTYLGGSGDDEGHAVAVDASGDAYITGCTSSTMFPDNSPNSPVDNPSGNKAVFVIELNPTGTATVQPINTVILGGSAVSGSVPGDCGNGIAVDIKGNVYVTGQTFSPTFPIAGSAVESKAPSGIAAAGTGFISVISPSAGFEQLTYSSYLGVASALNGDEGYAIALDATPNAYVVGRTLSTSGFTTGNAAQATNNAPQLTTGIGGNAFLAEINPTPPQGSSSTLLYYSYIGGSTGAYATAVTADSTGKAYITGKTNDSNGSGTAFPTTASSYVPSLATNSNGVGFFTVIDTTQSGSKSLFYSTYFGSTSGTGGGDTPSAIALNQNKIAYIAGDTSSSDFVTGCNPACASGVFQASLAGPHNAFLTLFNATQSGTASLLYSTFLGGTGTDIGRGVAVDSAGNAYVAGYTNSSSTATPPFPVTSGALQTTLPNSTDAGFVAKLSPRGNGAADLLYSTYLGGSGAAGDFAYAIAVGNASSTCNTCAYVTGATSSNNFIAITNSSLQPTYVGVSPTFDAFATMLPLVAGLGAQPASLNFQTQLVPAPITYPFQSVTITNNTSSNVSLTSYAVGTPFYTATPASTNGCSQSQNLPAGSSCVINVSFTPISSQATTPATSVPDTLVVNDSLQSSPQQKISLVGLATNSAGVGNISPTSITFGQVFLNSPATAQTVNITNAGNANLTVSSISISPANTIFSQTNTCSAPVTLIPGQGCSISVTFAPISASSSSATLSIVASDSTTAHTIPLSGSGVGFTITAPSALNVNSGSTGTLTMTMTPLGGFTGSVALSCSGNPTNSSCSISPVSVAATNGITAQTATVTVGTTSGLLAPSGRQWPLPLSGHPAALWALALMMLITFACARRLRSRLLFGTAILLFVVIGGCGASHTTSGNYTLTLTGTSGSLTQTATFTLTVNQ